LSYVKELPDQRWVKLAFHEQLLWAQQQGHCTGVLRDLREPHSNKTFWLGEVITRARIMDLPVHHTWTKYDIKLIKKRQDRVSLISDIAGKSTLRYLNKKFDVSDHSYHNKHHLWWQKARVEGFFLRHRYKDDNPLLQAKMQNCRVCLLAPETLEHFVMECKEITTDNKWLTYGQTTEEKLEQMLSEERTPLERSKISSYIHNRWSLRTQLLEEAKERKIRGQNINGPIPNPAT